MRIVSSDFTKEALYFRNNRLSGYSLSTLSIILESYADLMQNARVLISNHDALLSVYLVVAVIYILINYLLNRLSVFAAAHSGTAGAARI